MTEQFSVQDINAPDGRLGDRFHAWQKPDELAERVIAPGPNRAVAFKCKGVKASGGDGDDDAGESGNRHQEGSVGGGPVTKLAESVITPGPDRTVAFERKRVKASGGNGGDVEEAGNLTRGGLRGGGDDPVAELAKVISTPSPNRAVAFERKGMTPSGAIASAGNGNDIGEEASAARALHLHRGSSVGGGAVAELATKVSAPGPDRAIVAIAIASAIALNRKGVIESGCDGDGVLEIKNRHRSVCIGDGPVAELAGSVITPCPGGAGRRAAAGGE